MKYTMPNCIGKLSEHKLNTFEFIISHQYRKFIIFYNLLRSFSDNIEKFCYIFMNYDVLCVDIYFDSDTNPVDILQELQKNIKRENENIVIDCYVEDDRLTLKIDMTEVDGYSDEEIEMKKEMENITKQ